MKLRGVWALLLLAALATPAAPRIASSTLPPLPPHPRLILDPDRIAELRLLTHPTGDPHTWTERERVMHLAYRSIVAAADELVKNRLPTDDYWGSTDCAENAGQQGAAFQGLTALAMAHLLRTGEPAYDQSKKYLAYTVDLLETWRRRGYPMWGNPCFCDLNTGELLAGWALAFDWLYPELDSTQVVHCVAALTDLLEKMDKGGCMDAIDGRLDNNHIGVAYGGRGLAALAQEGHLAGDREIERQARLSAAAENVSRYLDYAFPGGSGYEGVMYSNYGLNIALPFALSSRRLAADLPPEGRVEVPLGRGAQQAGTWLVYEQLPANRHGATPLNDTVVPPWDLNPPFWRAWPWLMAFGDERAPSAIRHLFFTTYTPAEIEANVLSPFDPDSIREDLSGVLFSQIGPWRAAGYYNAVAILLGWPDPGLPASAHLDPSTMPASRAFPERGLVCFRTSLHQLDGAGALASDSNATLITFECRGPAAFTPDGHHTGHSQFDQNQFTVFSRGAQLFSDTGYEGWPPRNGTHNTEMIQPEGGDWSGFRTRAPTTGRLLRWHFGRGIAPSMAAGEDTEAWNFSDLGEPPQVDHSRRHFVVLPRGEGEAPYVLFHDDLDFAGESRARTRWFWHAGSTKEDPDFEVDLPSRTASISLGRAVATVRVLSPDSMETMNSGIEEGLSWFWAHRVLTVQTGLRANADLVVLAAFTDDLPARMNARRLATADSMILAFEIVEGNRTDLAVFRRGNAPGSWTMRAGGHALRGDAEQTIIRFAGADPEWESISAGMMIQGSEIWFDDRLVAGLRADEGRGDLVFSPEQVEVQAPQTPEPRYLVGPFVPATAMVNDLAQPVRIWDDLVPPWLEVGGREIQIGPATPNPAAHQVRIPFYLRSPAHVRIAIYDAQGRFVRELEDGVLPVGLHRAAWDRQSNDGREIAAGLYFYTLQAFGQTTRGRLVIVR